jgi:colicin import membrane protein
MKLESQIDELYQLPLEEFTKARNTLAKSLSGDEKKAVASLVKPSVPMWVVNQLHWENGPTYKALIDASEKLRTAHRAALTGKNVDTRKAEELHRTTVEKAFAQAVAATGKKGIRLSDAARDAVRRTLNALPTDEPAGRITREPPAAGFSLLTGIKPRPATPAKKATPEPKLSAAELKRQQLAEKQAERIRIAAERRARLEEEKTRKQEAEQARKEKETRQREIEKAEQALRDAERRLAELKR